MIIQESKPAKHSKSLDGKLINATHNQFKDIQSFSGYYNKINSYTFSLRLTRNSNNREEGELVLLNAFDWNLEELVEYRKM